MPTYDVSKLIGKNLILKKEVSIYRNITDDKPVYKGRPGQSAGIIFSWVTNKKTGHIWLMFEDKNKKPYYINTKDLSGGAVDTKELQREGVKSTKEIEKEAEKKAAPVEFYLKKYGPYAAGAVLLLLFYRRA